MFSVILYVTVLSGILVALLTQVLLMTSVAERMCKSSLISSLLANRIFRIIFILPTMKVSNTYITPYYLRGRQRQQSAILTYLSCFIYIHYYSCHTSAKIHLKCTTNFTVKKNIVKKSVQTCEVI